MFENIIEQGAVCQLRDDILSVKNAPSMLFFGPLYSGKGSAALEAARVFSCEQDAAWKCSCPSCERHRLLLHDDMLVLGRRSFASEIEACKSAFLGNPSNQNIKLLFFRSIRKLIIRFSPVVMDDDPKFSKISSILSSLDEKLNEFWDNAQEVSPNNSKTDDSALEKKCASLIKDAFALENEGINANIPVGHIRSASYWCRLAPGGKQKTLIIENAEKMKSEAHNSLLKLLEEPPSSVNIILTTQRKEALIQTILSRLRPYRFLKRSREGEREIIRRVFQSANESGLSEYLDSFTPQSSEKMYPLAAWFIVSFARIASLSCKKNAADVPAFLNILGGRYAPTADATGFEKCLKSSSLIKTVISHSENFKDASFSRFMKICLDMISSVMQTSEDAEIIRYCDLFKKYINEAASSVDVLNINEAAALEALFFKLKKAVVQKLSLRGLYG